MYNYNHLYYFYVAAKSGGINSAAKHLKISQPSLSSQIKVLEQNLNIQLFQKVGRSSQLTPDGTVIYSYCRRMFEISEEMAEELSDKIPSASRRVHIGISDEVDRPFVVEIVSLFLKTHGLTQRPKVTIVSGSHDLLVERLRFRELDAIVTQQAMAAIELENLAKAEVPVALACASNWKVRSSKKNLASPEAIREIVGNEPQWIMPSRNFKLRAETDRFFETSHLKGRIVFESDVLASMVRSAVDGIGFAFLPLLYISREVREKSLKVLSPKQGYWKYRVWLACHQQTRDDSLVRVLAKSFKKVCSESA